MPKNIRNLTVCSTLCFKKKLDLHLSTIPDLPNTPNLSNSLDNKYKLELYGVTPCDLTDEEDVG